MPTLEELSITTITPADNKQLAQLIRNTLKEFGANRPGTVYYDETTDSLYEVFSNQPHSIYYVAKYNGEIVGAGGIYPSPGLPDDTCELVKMYLYPHVRGIGLGKLLIEKAIQFAKDAGFKKIYIETMPELKQALLTYEKFGFYFIDHSLGNTGHHGCDLFMLKEL